MSRYRIGTQAGGVAGMSDVCVYAGTEPQSTYQEYTEVVGQDLNGSNIEAGLPRAAWTWAELSQSEFDAILDLLGTGSSAYVYIRTRLNTGASDSDFANFLAIMQRPTSTVEGRIVHREVEVQFVQLVAA